MPTLASRAAIGLAGRLVAQELLLLRFLLLHITGVLSSPLSGLLPVMCIVRSVVAAGADVALLGALSAGPRLRCWTTPLQFREPFQKRPILLALFFSSKFERVNLRLLALHLFSIIAGST